MLPQSQRGANGGMILTGIKIGHPIDVVALLMT
jgi:hypothetical protein